MCTAQLMCVLCSSVIAKILSISFKHWLQSCLFLEYKLNFNGSKYFFYGHLMLYKEKLTILTLFFKFKLFIKGFNIFLCRGQKCGSVRKIWQPSVHHSTWFLVFSKLWFRDWSNVLTLGIPEGTNQSINQSFWRNYLCLPCLLKVCYCWNLSKNWIRFLLFAFIESHLTLIECLKILGHSNKRIEPLSHTLIFLSLYICNPMSYDFRYFKLWILFDQII